MIKNLAPVLVFCYNRLDELKCTIEALKKNYLSFETELYIFSDGAKPNTDEQKIRDIRTFLRSIEGFKKIYIFESPTNKGLANSIIDGVTTMFNKYDKVIVLEDDLITSSNFLIYMNKALDYYENKNIFSISGFSFPIVGVQANSVYFTMRSSPWGWATWRTKWMDVDWEVTNYKKFKVNTLERKKFNYMGSDLTGMLDRQMLGKMDSWFIRWCYQQFKNQSYTVHPAISKIQNIGFGPNATHTNENPSRYRTNLDESSIIDFDFKDTIIIEKRIIQQVLKHYSIPRRAYFKFEKLIKRYIRIIKQNFKHGTGVSESKFQR